MKVTTLHTQDIGDFRVTKKEIHRKCVHTHSILHRDIINTNNVANAKFCFMCSEKRLQ